MPPVNSLMFPELENQPKMYIKHRSKYNGQYFVTNPNAFHKFNVSIVRNELQLFSPLKISFSVHHSHVHVQISEYHASLRSCLSQLHITF